MTPLDSTTGSSSLTRVGGGLGIGAVILGLAIFLSACAGFGGALKLSFLPVALGGVGLLLTVLGGVFQDNPEATHVIAAIFPCVIGILGGVLEMAAWLNWTIFAR